MRSEGLAFDRLDAEIILIRGAPGIGKSTLAEMLRRTRKDSAVIDVDDIRRMICSERFIFRQNTHYMAALGVVGDLVSALSRLGRRPIIVVDVFAGEAFHSFVQVMHGARIFSVSLYTDDDVLIGRMQARHGGYINSDVARAVNRHIYETRELSDAWLDIGTLSAVELCERFLELVAYES